VTCLLRVSVNESRTAPSHRFGLTPAVLAAVADPEVTLAVWRRRVPTALAPQLRSWALSSAAEYDEELGAQGYRFETAFQGLRDRPIREFLSRDVSQLVGHLLRITRAPRFRLVFGAVRGDQCRKFHTDMLRYRLLTTYLGPGTEWLPESNLRRTALTDSPPCPVAANAAIVRDPARIRRARTGDVLLMKGAASAGPERALVHRSPPIEGTGEVRVVLALSVYESPS
jgi:hypothetical protein